MNLLSLISKCEGRTIKKEAKVLDEDLYMENLGKIIVRDYFPDLPALKAKLEPDFDLVKAKDAQSVCATPSQFGTPASSVGHKGVKTPAELFLVEEVEELTDAQLEKMSLNKYLNTYTSEDNASFNEIMKEFQRKLREKQAWMYKDEQLQIEDNSDKKKQLTWNYVPLNFLMYVPDGVDLSVSEKLAKYSLKKQKVCPENTRFTVQPYNQTTEAIKTATIKRMEGRIGLDGKEILPSNTPKMGGYGFMGTPSPAPGIDASPLMTWGDIEGTPCRIDGPQTPRHGGPIFKIPDLPVRDKVLHKLTEEINKSHRAKKTEALRQATATFANSPRSLMSRTEKIQSMSPAAQRLMSGKLRINTNSPLSKPVTPTLLKTPVSTPTPKAYQRLEHVSIKKRTALPSDDLLQLPLKKTKASDFF